MFEAIYDFFRSLCIVVMRVADVILLHFSSTKYNFPEIKSLTFK